MLDSSRDDWNQVEASNRCSPMKGFPFGRLFLFVVESGIIEVVRSSAVETIDKETSRPKLVLSAVERLEVTVHKILVEIRAICVKLPLSVQKILRKACLERSRKAQNDHQISQSSLYSSFRNDI